MESHRWSCMVLVMVLVIAGVVGRREVPAQDTAPARPKASPAPPPTAKKQPAPTPHSEHAPALAHEGSLEAVLGQKSSASFAAPVSLAELVKALRKQTHAAVVLDPGALKRLQITADEKVALDLEGVRLGTMLRLLLGQVNMTYKVVPEDNLLILTDDKGADDRIDLMARELEELHQDVHDLQDAVEAIYDAVAPEPALRRPTIIEEHPGDDKGKAPTAPVPRPRAG